jgi:hypothetical protein
MRWIGTAFLVLVVVGFIWSILEDLFTHVCNVRFEPGDCPSSDEVFDKRGK